jgi:pimeloyl-ACP methyl ester carboxylesterase
VSPLVDVGSVSLFYESTVGHDPAIVLIAGRGGQLTDWNADLVADLAESGSRVIRFDCRDAGLSTHFDDDAVDLLGVATGKAKSPYSLQDMADDVAGLLDALDVRSAIVVGMSLGGMVAQRLVLSRSDLVSGLVLISTSTGARDVGQPSAEIQEAMFRSASQDRPEGEDLLARVVRASSRWTSWELGVTEEDLTSRVKARIDRRYDPAGAERHLAAVIDDVDRTDALRTIDVPTVVIHGALDPLIDVSGGRALAAAIAGAELVVIDQMAHDLPRSIWPTVVAAVERVRR